ncbi:hypothetical protein AVEN_44677-1 [Araneus ventricosus]|uniref:Uncharacterized protein n=1 Tax=Araneus ventricosus TaxID=182803 RepID=A0A4Y2AWN7_ARAVE|nr:hypothetical protein AVEN_44677-1 [Araneus ventricosus]
MRYKLNVLKELKCQETCLHSSVRSKRNAFAKPRGHLGNETPLQTCFVLKVPVTASVAVVENKERFSHTRGGLLWNEIFFFRCVLTRSLKKPPQRRYKQETVSVTRVVTLDLTIALQMCLGTEGTATASCSGRSKRMVSHREASTLIETQLFRYVLDISIIHHSLKHRDALLSTFQIQAETIHHLYATIQLISNMC